MRIIIVFLYILFFLPGSFLLQAQSTADLFSIEGLNINAYHYNFFDGTFSSSYTFVERRQGSNNEDTLKFISNRYGTELLLLVKGKKVYIFSRASQTEYLLYDFNSPVGYVFSDGVYMGYEVIKHDSITLLNGDKRKMIDLKKGSLITTIVEGIGDIKHSLLPIFYDFEGSDVFVCAKIYDQLLVVNTALTGSECDEYSCVWPIPGVELHIDNFTVTLQNNSLYANNFFWDFGDGQTSTEKDPIHVYNTPGCYSITLAVRNDCYQGQLSVNHDISICFKSGWEKIYTNDTMRFSIFPFDEDTDYAYNAQSLYKVTNKGQNWQKLSLETVDGEKRDFNTMKMWDENRGVAGCKGHNGVIVTDDGGLTWIKKVEEAYWTLDVITETNGRAYASAGVYTNEFYRTSDFGQSWQTLPIDNTSSFHKIYRFLYADSSIVIAQAFKGFWDNKDWRLGVSNDHGEHWQFLTIPFAMTQLQFVDNKNGFGTNGDRVWHTADAGLTWTIIPGLHDIFGIFMHNATHGWVVNSSREVLYSKDRFETSNFTACGNDRISFITTFTDSTAATFVTSSDRGTEKYLYKNIAASDCSVMIDADGDGFFADSDCDDTNADINPAQAEIPYNGLDDDCDTTTLDDDLDMDGFLLMDDCDDSNAEINPIAIEIPGNGIDEDCDGLDSTSGIFALDNTAIKIFTNNATNELHIVIHGFVNFKIEIYDLSGRKLISSENQKIINMSPLPTGIYIVELGNTESGKKIFDKIFVGN